MAFDFIPELGLFSPKSTQNSNVVNTTTSSQYQSTQNSNYSTTSTFTDSRQLILILNSPNSTTSTKKNDAVSSASTPSLTSNPSNTNTPSTSTSLTPSNSTGQPSILGSLFGDSSNILLIGAVLVGAVLIFGGRT